MSLEFLSLETIQEFAQQYGYVAVLMGILLENTGIPLPGETITLVGGFLAGSGELNYWLVLASAIAGAVVGSNLGYWLGFYGGWPLLLRLSGLFRLQETHLLEIKTRFNNNSVRVVFLGRFIPFLRVFASPMAGIVRMPYGQFFVANTAGATAWAGVMVSLAFFVGQVMSLEQLVTRTGQFSLLLLAVVVALVAIPLWLENRRKPSYSPEAAPIQNHLEG